MQAWASWAAFLVLIGGAYFYYTKNERAAAARGRTTTRAGSAKESMQWAEPEKKSKAAPKQAKAKAPRKSVKTAVQEAGNKAEAYLSSAVGASTDDDDNRATQAPSGRSVADMLEPQAAAAAVLNIKPSGKPARSSKPQAPKVEAVQESKKQRQNRKKVEEQKAQREAEEKERQGLLEKQRRTAREARGEPAKNGVPIDQAPESNPWTKIRPKGVAQAPEAVLGGQLLDTFEAAPTVSSVTAPSNGTAPTTGSASTSGHYNGLPSEEEQVRFAMEDSAWTTVPKGGKKQKAKVVGGDLTDEGSDSGAAQKYVPVQPTQPVRPKVAENKKPLSRYSILDESFTAKPDDPDDWPVV
ncbi:hypothetical protein P153DRAFT_383659 [Dothidotthia symphoricarpi CBS 119687]|uniref:Uncharacterized protein n=1 Tax=Dothidotthia symphoricarpi CBS 119687 TaxID=1392245 RepID=A0A6A6AKD9_9PLEO|nr:uncharacterized protein P153DRAFT_383659 [Dothidotthia symphoricarpi CBS 119687]KAF2131565.1 hypothetical protein P153DRAFT_383659 [Dothidotthia symphoricarpi CBS 119687]